MASKPLKAKDYIKKRRKRTVISAEQLKKLEHCFQREAWPDRLKKSRLAREIGTPDSFISVWFQNRRARARRENEQVESLTFGCPASSNPPPPLKAESTDDTALAQQEQSGQNFKKAEPAKVKVTSKKSPGYPYSLLPSCGNKGPSKFPHHDYASHGKHESHGIQNAHNMTTTSAGHIKRLPVKKKKKKKGKVACRDLVDNPSREPTMLTADVTDYHPFVPHPSYLHQIYRPKHKDDCFKCGVPVKDEETGGSSRSGRIPRQRTLFEAIIDMIAVAEGGIITEDDPCWDASVNDSLYGINLGDTTRLVCDPDLGVDLLPLGSE